MFPMLLKNEERRGIGKRDRKAGLLKEIDWAMLDENRRKSLKKEISKGLGDFGLPVPRFFDGEGKHGKCRVTAW